jgi:hypothetical protein
MPPTGTPSPWAAPTSTPPRRSNVGLIVGVVLAVVVVACAGLGFAAYALSPHNGQPNTSTGAGTPTATSGATIVFQDSLTSNTNGWYVQAPYCQFAHGGYQIGDDSICLSPSQAVGNATISVRARQISGATNATFGIVMRHASKGNYYAFHIVGLGQWDFIKVVNGRLTRIVDWTDSSAISRGLNAINTLAVTGQGSHFILSINGTQVGQANDTTFASGDTGLAGGTSMQVVYNDFKITEP